MTCFVDHSEGKQYSKVSHLFTYKQLFVFLFLMGYSVVYRAQKATILFRTIFHFDGFQGVASTKRINFFTNFS